MEKSPFGVMTVIALALLAAAAAVFVSLGQWQLGRAEERQVLAEQIDWGRTQPPIDLTVLTPPHDMLPWRPAKTRGVWLGHLSVWLDNRNLEGRPGLWLATPLMLEGGKTLLVLRGWIARPIGADPEPVVPTMKGPVDVQGELLTHVPRLYELKSVRGETSAAANAGFPAGWPDSPTYAMHNATIAYPRVQNLELTSYADLTKLNMMPVVMAQTNDAKDGLTRQWPGPSVDFEKNKGYALQWFSFAGIAMTAWLGIIWRTWRRHKGKAAT